MVEKQKGRLTEGPVQRTIVRMSLPMVFGLMSIIGFNLIDTYFVGLMGTTELAALSFSFPVVFLLGSLAIGLGTAASSVISRAIGEGDLERVRRLTTDALAISLVIVIILVSLGLSTMEPLFKQLGARGSSLALVIEYMQIWYFGMIFLVVPMVGNSIIRATGNTIFPGALMTVAAILNGLLDPLLIFGWGPVPALGMQGAALASVIARGMSFFTVIYFLTFRKKMLSWRRPDWQQLRQSWQEILDIALPAGGTNMVVPLSYAFVTRMTATYGKEAVASLGVISRIESFAFLVLVALASVISPFVGQNWGANERGRIHSALVFGRQVSILWGVVLWFVFWLFGETIARVFSEEPLVIKWVRFYFMWVPASYGFHGILLISSSSLTALKKPWLASLLMILRAFILYVPLAYVFSHWYGVEGILLSPAVANFVAGLCALVVTHKQLGLGRA